MLSDKYYFPSGMHALGCVGSGLSECVSVDDAIRHGSLNFSSRSLLAAAYQRFAVHYHYSPSPETRSRDVKPIYLFLPRFPATLRLCSRSRVYVCRKNAVAADSRARKISFVVGIGLFRFVIIQHCPDSERDARCKCVFVIFVARRNASSSPGVESQNPVSKRESTSRSCMSNFTRI